MASLADIKSSRVDRPLRLILLGAPKCGKSTLASQVESPIFIPVKGEEGIDALDVPAFPVAEKFGDVMDSLKSLYDKHDFKTIVLDSISTFELLVWDEACRINGGVDSIEKVGGGYGKGYLEAVRKWRALTEALDFLRSDIGMGCILIGHVKAKKFNDPLSEPYDRWSCDINERAVEYLTRWSDGILFCQHKIIVKKQEDGFGRESGKAVDVGAGQPYLYTQWRPAHPGGGRGAWSRLPYELPCSWPAFAAAFANARQQ